MIERLARETRRKADHTGDPANMSVEPVITDIRAVLLFLSSSSSKKSKGGKKPTGTFCRLLRQVHFQHSAPGATDLRRVDGLAGGRNLRRALELLRYYRFLDPSG